MLLLGCARLPGVAERADEVMQGDRLYDWSAVLTAQLLNLHLGPDKCKAEQFQLVLFLVLDAMRLADSERREMMLRPSLN